MKKIINTNIIAVEVPLDATNINVWNHGIGFKAKRIERDPDDSNGYFHLHTGLGRWRDFVILGEATENEISFDIDPYVEKKHFTSLFDGKTKFHYKNYVNPDSFCLGKKESFYSLLQASGLSLEQNKIKGKIIFLKKL